MPAHKQEFPWPSHYGEFDFFERAIGRHTKVSALKEIDKGLYDVQRTNGPPLRVFICECYSFGVAEYLETAERLGDIDAIVINSNWCAYTSEVKRYCREEEVGIFKIGGFMGALNRPDYWNYLDDDEKEYFRKKGWL